MDSTGYVPRQLKAMPRADSPAASVVGRWGAVLGMLLAVLAAARRRRSPAASSGRWRRPGWPPFAVLKPLPKLLPTR